MNFILFTRQITRTLYYVDEFIPSPKRFKIFTHKSDIKKKKKYTCTNLTEWLLFIHIYKNCIQYYTYTLILKFTIQRNNNKKFNGSENRLKKPSIDPLLVHSAENIASIFFFFLHLHLNKRQIQAKQSRVIALSRETRLFLLHRRKPPIGRVVIFPPPPLFPESDETTTQEGVEGKDTHRLEGRDGERIFDQAKKNVIQFKNHSLSARASPFLSSSFSFFFVTK